MNLKMKMIAVLIGCFIFVYIIELVRRRKLREEYSWLWLMTGAGILLLTLWFGLLKWMAQLVGAVAPASALFLFTFLFLILISLHFSVVISKLTGQNKNLAQKYALMELEFRELKKQNLSAEADLRTGV